MNQNPHSESGTSPPTTTWTWTDYVYSDIGMSELDRFYVDIRKLDADVEELEDALVQRAIDFFADANEGELAAYAMYDAAQAEIDAFEEVV